MCPSTTTHRVPVTSPLALFSTGPDHSPADRRLLMRCVAEVTHPVGIGEASMLGPQNRSPWARRSQW
jgi:hypothetical protein